MPGFMLLLYQSPSKFKDISPEDIQRIIGKYKDWREDLVRRNKLRGGEKLTDDGGSRLQLHGGDVSVTDGPYSETTEVLGGYFVIEAANYEEALQIARTCPHLVGTQRIEVRQIDAIHQ